MTPLENASRIVPRKPDYIRAGIALRNSLGLVLPEELAAALLITPETLALWRSKKQGPAATRFGKSVFYQMRDIDAWVKDMSGTPEVTSEGN